MDGLNGIAAKVATVSKATGLSRSTLYNLAAAGEITFRKAGRATLVDLASVRAYWAKLPTAEISPRP